MNSKYNNLQFDGQTVLITGGAGILGQHFCRGFHDAGARIVILDKDGDAAKKTATALGTRALGLGCDIANPDDVKEAVTASVAEMGSIDVLLNNAGSKSRDVRAFFAPFEEYDLDIWRDVMSVNIDGMFLMSQAAGQQMLEQRDGGAIINISSIYGIVGPDPRIYEGSEYLGGAINTPAVYSASKAAVVGLTKWMATHWAKKNIRVNCLVPGGVSSGQNGPFQRNYSNRVPMARMAEADEMVGPALFLASTAASYVTGQVLAADGGWTAW